MKSRKLVSLHLTGGKTFEDLHRTAKFFGKENIVKQKAAFNFVDLNLLKKGN